MERPIPLAVVKVAIPDELSGGTVSSVSLDVHASATIGVVLLLAAEQVAKKAKGVSIETISLSYGLVDPNQGTSTILNADRELMSLYASSSGTVNVSLAMVRHNLPRPSRAQSTAPPPPSPSQSVSAVVAPPPPPSPSPIPSPSPSPRPSTVPPPPSTPTPSPSASSPPPSPRPSSPTLSMENKSADDALDVGRVVSEMPSARTGQGPLIGPHRHRLKNYASSFVGTEAVDWLTTLRPELSRVAASSLLDRVSHSGAFTQLSKEPGFRDSSALYLWTDPWASHSRKESGLLRESSVSIVEQEEKPTEEVKEKNDGLKRNRAGLLDIAAKLQQGMSQGKNVKGKALIGDHRSGLSNFKNSFVGEEAVGWTVQNGVAGVTVTRETATFLFDDLLTLGAIAHVSKGYTFKDSGLIYRWQDLTKLSVSDTFRAPESAKSLAETQQKLLSFHMMLEERTKSRRSDWELRELPEIKAHITALQGKLTVVQKLITEAKEAAAKKKEIVDLETITGPDGSNLEASLATIKSQLDGWKQKMHFPEPEGWLLRLGADGVYVGIKGFSLDALEATFLLRMGKDLPSEAGANHQLHIKASQVTVRLAVDCLSVVAEKHGVPNLLKPRLVISAEVAIDARLYFAPKPKKWRTRGFDCKVNINQSEGLGLPAPLVKWVSSTFLPSVIRTGLVAALPPELAVYLNQQVSDALNLTGQVRLRGIPLSVLDQVLNLGVPASAKDVAQTPDLSATRRAAVSLLGNAGIGSGRGIYDAALQAHMLAKLRRRAGLKSLKKLAVFGECSKWSTLGNFGAYVSTLDRLATPQELAQAEELWQTVVSYYTAEDGLPWLSVPGLFQQMRRVSRSPQEVLFELSKISINLELGGILTMAREIAIGALKGKKSKEAKQAALKIERAHSNGVKDLQTVMNALSRVKASIQGSLLGGSNGGSFEVSIKELCLSALPNVKVPLSVLNIAPSDIALSMFAKEGKDGGFVIDIGVPIIEDREEEIVGDSHPCDDPSFMLSTARTTPILPRKEVAVTEEDKEEGLAKYFPSSQRIVVVSLQHVELAFRLDSSSISDPTLFKGQFTKGTEGAYSVNITGAKGLCMDLDLQGVRAAGAPGLIARWVQQTLREERRKQGGRQASAQPEEGKEQLLASELAAATLFKDIQSVHLLFLFNLVAELKCAKGLCTVEVGQASPECAVRFANYYFAVDLIQSINAIVKAVQKDASM